MAARERRRRTDCNIGFRNRAKQVADGDGAGLGEILTAEIGHRHTHRGGAVNQRPGDKHLFRHCSRGCLGHLRLRDLLRVCAEHVRQRQQRSRTHQGCETAGSRIHISPFRASRALCGAHRLVVPRNSRRQLISTGNYPPEIRRMSDDTLPLLTGKCACTHVMSALPSRW